MPLLNVDGTLDLKVMRLNAQGCKEECQRLFAASNALRGLEIYSWDSSVRDTAAKLWKEAVEIEKWGAIAGIFNEMEGWFCEP